MSNLSYPNLKKCSVNKRKTKFCIEVYLQSHDTETYERYVLHLQHSMVTKVAEHAIERMGVIVEDFDLISATSKKGSYEEDYNSYAIFHYKYNKRRNRLRNLLDVLKLKEKKYGGKV